MDRMLGEATNSPTVRFIERCGGGTVIDLLGRSNPWAKEWQCPRTNCLPCKGRYLLSTEEDSRKSGEGPPMPRPGKEETLSVPKCTGEGIGYYLECWTCRLQGKEIKYVGESSRSAFQRGKEHSKEIGEARKTHPMTQHFQEKHQGQQQEVLMRTVRQARTALEWQVWESVMIDRLSPKWRPALTLKVSGDRVNPPN